MELTDLRGAALEILTTTLRAVDAREAVRQAISVQNSQLRIDDITSDISPKSLYVVALGKAAHTMAAGLSDVLGDFITGGVVSGPLVTDQIELDPRWQVFAGGHPLPNQESLQAADAAFKLLRQANEERAAVVFLVSGGGSAMIEWPSHPNITLEELRIANRVLVSSGASIAEINSVRRAISSIKNGGLAARAPQTNQLTLIISDTNPGDEANVASGPSLPYLHRHNASAVLEKYGLQSSLPTSVLNAVEECKPSTPITVDTIRYARVLLTNENALKAAADAAERLNLSVQIADDISEQPIEQGCELLLTRVRNLIHASEGKTVCLISGGEFSCPVRGNGIGGRNLETVLRCAMTLDEENRKLSQVGVHVVILSAGTDGIDGNSSAAGAIADEKTIPMSRLENLDAKLFLEASDSFHFFSELGDIIMMGPTGTNVRDIRIILASS